MTPPSASPRPELEPAGGTDASRGNWWYSRHMRFDGIVDAINHIAEVEVRDVTDQAAAEAIELGYDPKQTAQFVNKHTLSAQDMVHPDVVHAVEQIKDAWVANVQAQIDRHIYNHGCHEGCRLLRGPAR